MRKHRILLMMHKTLVPPEDVAGMSESEIDESGRDFLRF